MDAYKTRGKPFIKWVGGKSQLIGQIETLFPRDFAEWRDATYIEPFVGANFTHHTQNSWQNQADLSSKRRKRYYNNEDSRH